MTLLLAHAGAGATWQALLTVMSVGLAVVLILVVVGRIRLDTPGDLTLPIAAVAVLSSLAPVGGDPLSDAAPWAVPAGVVVLVGLVATAVSRRPATVRSPIIIGTVVAALVASLALAPTLVDAWYPDPAMPQPPLES